jgi:beta-phosphoglucomutase
LDASEISNTKPDPEVFIKVIEALELEASEVIIIEDSPLGVAAAKALGSFCIAIGDPVLLGAADKVLNSIKELNFEKSFQF